MYATSFERRYARAWRRAARSPRRPRVIISSAIGRTALAFATVVLIRPCSISGARKVRVERLAMRRVATELLSASVVVAVGPMPYSSPRRFRPCVASVSLTSSIDFLPKFGIAASSSSLLRRGRRSSRCRRASGSCTSGRRARAPRSGSSPSRVPAAPRRAGLRAASSPNPRSFDVREDRELADEDVGRLPIASCGSMEPSVVMSKLSLS